MKKLFLSVVMLLSVVLALCSFAGCGGTGAQGPKGDVGSQGPVGPQGPKGDSALVGNDTPDKVWQLGDTVSYYSNGLKLFDIQVTAISILAGGTRAYFVFTPYSFYPETNLGKSIGAVLVHNATQTSSKSAANITDSGIGFGFDFVGVFSSGQKTLYVCIASGVDMRIPFAVFSLSV